MPFFPAPIQPPLPLGLMHDPFGLEVRLSHWQAINGTLGLRVPAQVTKTKCVQYMRRGKPSHRTQLINDTAYSIVAQYQAEYRGVVQYYRLAYNLHQLSKRKRVMEVSQVKTLANKYKTSCGDIYKRYNLGVSLSNGRNGLPSARPSNRFGVSVSEIVQRLRAEKCELCGATAHLEAHHMRKLADLTTEGRKAKPQWVQRMIARRRKSLMVCQHCLTDIRKLWKKRKSLL